MSDLTGRILGPYQILEKLGLGGTLIHYKACQIKQSRYVELRTLSDYLLGYPPAVESFKRDSEAWFKLNHPNIVAPLQYSEADGIPYRVSEYHQGTCLRDQMEATPRKPLPLSEAARVTVQVAAALEYAHGQGIVHGDVKPSNVFIAKDQRVFLIDFFGLTKTLENIVGRSLPVGKPEYMAPEQVTGGAIDHRCDLYSLGVVFYRMLTGRVPFEAETLTAVVLKHLADAVIPPQRLNPRLPEEIDLVLLRVLSKQPDDRYQTARELIEDVRPFLEKISIPLDPTILHPLLVEHFSLEELQTLCFRLKVDYEMLGGEGKEGKARELLKYLERHSELEKLVNYLHEQRPDIKPA
jgi:eukaryotic-like serine/threonine-protein kinase